MSFLSSPFGLIIIGILLGMYVVPRVRAAVGA